MVQNWSIAFIFGKANDGYSGMLSGQCVTQQLQRVANICRHSATNLTPQHDIKHTRKKLWSNRHFSMFFCGHTMGVLNMNDGWDCISHPL
jgi:hypothetical protein